MKNSESNLSECLIDVLDVAQKAGRTLIKFQKKLNSLHISTKEAQGVVSEADVETEKLIIKFLKKRYPEIDFLAEESSHLQGSNYSKNIEWQWIIDPLDGTANFLNGLDYYAVSIALAYKGKSVLGVVYRPKTEEIFYTYGKNRTTYRTKKSETHIEKRILKKKLKDTILATGFVSEKGNVDEEEFKLFRKILPSCRGVRRCGSAALDLCYVAVGKFDGFWEKELCPWDVAAAGLICLNAGVKVTNWNKTPFSPFHVTIIASRGGVYRELIGLF